MDAEFSKLRDFLLSRDYNSSIVDSALVRAKAIPREVALKKGEKKEKPVAEFKEFELRFKYGWFHLKLYQMFQYLSRR